MAVFALVIDVLHTVKQLGKTRQVNVIEDLHSGEYINLSTIFFL